MTTSTRDYEYYHHGETIRVAVQCSGPAHEPHVRWHVGDQRGERGYIHLDAPQPILRLEDGETARLHGQIVTTIPVPERIAEALNRQIEERGTVVADNQRVTSEPAAFPPEIDGFERLGWETDRHVMWYWRGDRFPPRAYQIEDGTLVFRAQEWANGLLSKQELVDRYSLDPVF